MPRKQLVAFGTAFGKFTKSKQFRLHVTCLDFVAQHAQHKVWLKPSAEHRGTWESCFGNLRREQPLAPPGGLTRQAPPLESGRRRCWMGPLGRSLLWSPLLWSPLLCTAVRARQRGSVFPGQDPAEAPDTAAAEATAKAAAKATGGRPPAR